VSSRDGRAINKSGRLPREAASVRGIERPPCDALGEIKDAKLAMVKVAPPQIMRQVKTTSVPVPHKFSTTKGNARLGRRAISGEPKGG
jgi:hypothetical protein